MYMKNGHDTFPSSTASGNSEGDGIVVGQLLKPLLEGGKSLADALEAVLTPDQYRRFDEAWDSLVDSGQGTYDSTLDLALTKAGLNGDVIQRCKTAYHIRQARLNARQGAIAFQNYYGEDEADRS